MSTILNGLPYSNQQTIVRIRGQKEVVKPAQIIVWASITDFDEDYTR